MRITIDKRNAILDAESNSKFYDKFAELEKKMNAELDLMSQKETPKWITEEMMQSGYLDTTTNFEIKGDYDSCLPNVKLSLPGPMPRNGWGSIELIPTATFKKLYKRISDLDTDRTSFRGDLRQILNSYTTVKKLLLAMPELAEHFKDEVTSMALVPVEQINKVRKSLTRDK